LIDVVDHRGQRRRLAVAGGADDQHQTSIELCQARGHDGQGERFERELREKNAELEAANQELESFSYSISHDLRAPLRAMSGFARILREDHGAELSPNAHRLLGRVESNATKLGDLVDGLLTFSRLSRQTLEKQPVAPAEIVRQVLEELQAEQTARAVEIRVAELPRCEADPT
jgi:light-regulated signal transduction histidine kinase (bacteriophytochrome)